MKHVENFIAGTRYIWAIAAAAVMFGGFVLLIAAIWDVVLAIFATITLKSESGTLRITMIEAVDDVLVSTVLYVIAIGLFQLFVAQDMKSRLPLWMQVSDVKDLESRMTSMVISVLTVILLSRVLNWDGEWVILALGLTVAAMTAAVALLMRSEQQDDMPHAPQQLQAPDASVTPEIRQ